MINITNTSLTSAWPVYLHKRNLDSTHTYTNDWCVIRSRNRVMRWCNRLNGRTGRLLCCGLLSGLFRCLLTTTSCPWWSISHTAAITWHRSYWWRCCSRYWWNTAFQVSCFTSSYTNLAGVVVGSGAWRAALQSTQWRVSCGTFCRIFLFLDLVQGSILLDMLQ